MESILSLVSNTPNNKLLYASYFFHYFAFTYKLLTNKLPKSSLFYKFHKFHDLTKFQSFLEIFYNLLKKQRNILSRQFVKFAQY